MPDQTQILLANGDNASSAWAPTYDGGQTQRWQTLADSSNSSYVTNTGGTALLRISFDDWTLPPLAIVRRIDWKGRVQFPNFPTGIYDSIAIYEGSDDSDQKWIDWFTSKSVGADRGAGSGSIDITFDSTTATPPIGAFPSEPYSTQTINSRAMWVRRWEGSTAFRLIKAWIEVVYNEAPVVSSVAVPSPSTSRPTLTWTYTDPEADAQERVHVKVFTSAQGSPGTAGGAVWEYEGPLSSQSIQIATDLQNGTTYYAYVRAGDAVGFTRYGAWSSAGSFTISLVAPPAPLLIVTAEPGLARYRIEATHGTYTDPQTFVVQRSLDDGATWATIRSADEAAPNDGATLLTYDYETPRYVDVRYRAQTVSETAGGRVASPWTDPGAGTQSLRLNGTVGGYASTPDSDAISLAGTPVLRLPGVTGNYASTPDSPKVSVIGDIDIRVKVTLDNWATGVIQYLVSKRANLGGYALRIHPAGTLEYIWGDGSSDKFISPAGGGTAWTVPAGGATKWLRLTHDVDNGSGGNTRSFYQSDDGETWNLIGTASVGAGTTFIADNTFILAVGGDTAGFLGPAGTIHYAEVRNGIGDAAPVVARFDPSTITIVSDQNPASLVSTTGETWTINGTRWGWKRNNEWRSLRLPGSSGHYASTPDNDAISLRGTGQGLRISGHQGSAYAATPDAAALDISGDIDVRAKVALDNWANGAIQNILSKRGSTGTGYALRVTPAGGLEFVYGNNAGADVFRSTIAMGFSPGATKWVRVTMDVDNGSGGSTRRWYHSDDGNTWTEFTSSDTTAGTVTIGNASASLELGAAFSGTSLAMKGLIHRVEVRDGIGGTVVAAPDFTASPWVIGDQSGTARSSGGQTWTLNGNAEIVAAAERRSLRLSGAGAARASAPDTAGLSVTGDIDLRAKIAADDYTPAAAMFVISKEQVGARSYGLGIDTTGRLIMRYSIDGTNAIQTVSTAAPSPALADGQLIWIRATRASASGLCNFYTSPDGTTWNAVGAANVAGTAGAIHDNASALEVGSRASGSDLFTGNVFYVEVRNGIDGTIVANPDFTARPWDVGESNGTTGADAAGNTWTLNGSGAKIQRAYASDLDVRVKVAMDDWTPAAHSILVAKRTFTGDERSYIFRVSAGGALAAFVSANGVTEGTVAVTGPGFTDGTSNWVRMTWRVSDGRVQFFKSSDGVAWTQVGTDQTANVWGVYDSTVPVEIGAREIGTVEPLAGNVFAVEVRNGIDGVIVANPDFQNQPWDVGESNGASGTDSAGNTWTINGSSSKIDRAYASDLDVRVLAALDDWIPPADWMFVGKYFTGVPWRSWRLYVNSAGRLALAVSSNGGVPYTATSSVNPGVPNGVARWVRATLVAATGIVTFYTSIDGESWSQVGTTPSLPGLWGIYDGSTALEIGSFNNGASGQPIGDIYAVAIRRGIDGPVVARFDANDDLWDTGDNGGTTRDGWTLNGDATIVGGLSMAVEGWWLKDPLAPDLNRRVEVAPGFRFRRKEPQQILEPLGRRESVVVSDGPRGIEGQVELWAKTRADYEAIEALVLAGRVLWLEDVLGRYWYVKIGQVTEWEMIRAQPTADEITPIRHAHRVVLPFVEVAAPTGAPV